MQRFHFRPRFVLLVPAPVEEVRATLADRLQAADDALEGRVRPRQVLAWIAPPARRIWSPSLDLNLRVHPDGTLVVGLIAPHPDLMTAYVFGSICLTFLLCLALTWSFVQITMGEPPLCLLGASASSIGLLGILASRRLGLLWARSQIPQLAALVDGFGTPRDDEEKLLAEGAVVERTA